jgi:diguanylate cyclase (GGDEF)-like protein
MNQNSYVGGDKLNMISEQISNLIMQYDDYYARGQYANSLEVANKLLQLAEQSNSPTEKMNAYIKLIHSYYSLGEIENTFENIIHFRILCEDYPSPKCDFYLQLIHGYIFEYEENFESAIHTFKQAYQLAHEIQSNRSIALSGNLYAHLLLKAGYAEQAHEQAIYNYHFIQRHLSTNLLYICQSQHILATTYIETNQFELALQVIEELKRNPILIHNKKERSRYLFAHATYFIKQGLYETAISYLRKSEEIAFQNNDTILMKRIYKLHAQIFAQLNDYRQAFIQLQNYTHLLEQTSKINFLSKTHELDLKQNAYLLERNANIDSLSGLYNRSYLEKTTNKWLQNARQNGDHICCIVFDVDNFKTINDTYGHLYGDEVIRHIGKNCKELFQSKDYLCARYGGDEFIIVLKNFGQDKVRPATQQLFKNITSRPISFENVTFSITISMGVVCTDVYPSKRFTQLFKIADQALYMAKRQGKNQILAMINSTCSL